MIMLNTLLSITVLTTASVSPDALACRYISDIDSVLAAFAALPAAELRGELSGDFDGDGKKDRLLRRKLLGSADRLRYRPRRIEAYTDLHVV